MHDNLSTYCDDLERRLMSLATADPFDQHPDTTNLAMAVESLKLIQIGRREPSAAKLARQTLAMIEARQRQSYDSVDDGERVRESAPVINGHVLLRPGECRHLHKTFPRCCPVCEGGLQVCRNCPEYEAGLDRPCQHSTPAESSEIMPAWHIDYCQCFGDPRNEECAYCSLYNGPVFPEKIAAIRRIMARDAPPDDDRLASVMDTPDPRLVSPAYRTTAERDLAQAEHTLAVLAEAIHMRQACECTAEFVDGIDRICEGCRIITAIGSALAEAREFLADGPEAA